MKYFWLLVKLILTFSLIYYAVRDVDFTKTGGILRSWQGVSVLAVTVPILLMQALIGGYRIIPILRMFNYTINAITGIKLWFLGSFLSQVMISFIAGDAARVFALTRTGVKAGGAIRAIFLERVFGFIAILILFIAALPFIFKLTTIGSLYWGAVAITSASVGVVAVFLILGVVHYKHNNKYIGKFFELGSISKYLYVSKISSCKILFISCVVQLCNILAIYVITNNVGAEITLLNSFIVGSPVMFLSMLPVSIGGWGVREYSTIVGFNIIGIPSEIALTVSIIMGLTALIASLPGSLLLPRYFESFAKA
jgi:uncharacterized membrane protein YbhN (UPF0104 family)